MTLGNSRVIIIIKPCKPHTLTLTLTLTFTFTVTLNLSHSRSHSHSHSYSHFHSHSHYHSQSQSHSHYDSHSNSHSNSQSHYDSLWPFKAISWPCQGRIKAVSCPYNCFILTALCSNLISPIVASLWYKIYPGEFIYNPP